MYEGAHPLTPRGLRGTKRVATSKMQCQQNRTCVENSHIVALPYRVNIKRTTAGTLKVLRDGSFVRFPCELLHGDETRIWLSSDRVLFMGSEVQITTTPVVRFGVIEACTQLPKGYLALVNVHEVVDATPKGSERECTR